MMPRPTMRRGPVPPAKQTQAATMQDRLRELKGRMGGLGGPTGPTAPVINRPVTPRSGPVNSGPMPPPTGMGGGMGQPFGGPQVNVQPTPPAMGGGMGQPFGGPQVNVQPNPALGGGMGPGMKRGGKVREKAEAKYASGGKVSSASSRGDGIAQRGKTKGRMI